MSIEHIEPKVTYSEAVRHGSTVYLSGQVPWKTAEKGSFTEQAREVFQFIDKVLIEAGSSKEHILSLQIFLRNPGDYSAMNAEFLTWLAGAKPPARSTLCGITFPNPHWLLEVVCVAALPKQSLSKI